MTLRNRKLKILQYQKKKYFNVGLIIFGIIFIYLVITIVMYLTTPRINAYEVCGGSILKDHAYVGLALREETVVYSSADGYINYCAKNNSKVRANTNIYAISNDKIELNSTAEETNTQLTEEEQHTFLVKLQNFNENFKESSFSETYLLKSDVESMMQSITNHSKLDEIQAILNSGNASGMTVYPTTDDGVVVYSVDGMEGLNVDNITPENLNKGNYEKTEFQNNTKIHSGEPAYKLITNENWTVVVEVSKETADFLKGRKYNQYVKVHFLKDNQTLWAGLSFKETKGKYLAYLSFDNSMIRYANERYLNVELILEDQTGLKIPNSAITSKDFYVLPIEYITQGGDSYKNGVMRQTMSEDGTMTSKFVPTTIYYKYQEEEDENQAIAENSGVVSEEEKKEPPTYVYVDADLFNKNDTLRKPDSMETLELKDVKKEDLKGVYNINKGYAVFKMVNILSEGEEYSIVETGNKYSLSNYDHIALDCKSVGENDVVF